MFASGKEVYTKICIIMGMNEIREAERVMSNEQLMELIDENERKAGGRGIRDFISLAENTEVIVAWSRYKLPWPEFDF